MEQCSEMKDYKSLISVIVPVYNVEKYLEECVKSIIRQTYKNIEILLIDDGSTDNSGKVCDDFAESDKRIKVFHKKNGGLSDARNYGVENASGKYVMFVDSDDIVAESIIEILYHMIVADKDLKLTACRLAHFKDGKVPEFFNSNAEIEYLSKEEALVNFLCQKSIPTSACAKLYEAELLHTIKFVKGQRFEDNEFIFKIITNCKKIGYCNLKLYAYRHREYSITTSKFDEKEFDIIDIGNKIVKCSQLFSIEVQEAAVIYQTTNCLRICLTASEDFTNGVRYKFCYDYLKSNARVVMKNSNARKKLKVALFLTYLGVPMNLLRAIRSRKSRWS